MPISAPGGTLSIPGRRQAPSRISMRQAPQLRVSEMSRSTSPSTRKQPSLMSPLPSLRSQRFWLRVTTAAFSDATTATWGFIRSFPTSGNHCKRDPIGKSFTSLNQTVTCSQPSSYSARSRQAVKFHNVGSGLCTAEETGQFQEGGD